MGDETEQGKPPESFVRDCAELGFIIGGWDATTAGVFGHGAEFVGTHAEVMAFLRGWIGCEMRKTVKVLGEALSYRKAVQRLLPADPEMDRLAASSLRRRAEGRKPRKVSPERDPSDTTVNAATHE